MDYQLLALIALIIAVVIAATRQHSRSWPGRPGWQYQRVFSVGFAGLLFFVSGVIGWDLSRSHGLFRARNGWTDPNFERSQLATRKTRSIRPGATGARQARIQRTPRSHG